MCEGDFDSLEVGYCPLVQFTAISRESPLIVTSPEADARPGDDTAFREDSHVATESRVRQFQLEAKTGRRVCELEIARLGAAERFVPLVIGVRELIGRLLALIGAWYELLAKLAADIGPLVVRNGNTRDCPRAIGPLRRCPQFQVLDR